MIGVPAENGTGRDPGGPGGETGQRAETEDMAQFTILGADGFVGTRLVRHLESRGHAVAAPARNAPWPRGGMGHAVYCIGLTADYLQRPLDTVEAHVSLFARLLREADFASAVYLSSTRLYDSSAAVSANENDDLVLNPNNARHLYDFSKALGETMCLTCGRDGVRAARLSCVYSDDLAADTFLHGLLRNARPGRRIEVNTHLESARDYVHIDDVCAAIAEISLRGRRPIYNVASGENVSNRALFRLIERTTGCRIAVTAPPGRNAEYAPRVDIGALAEDFGMAPRLLGSALASMAAAHIPQRTVA